jgi:hypothetical protein
MKNLFLIGLAMMMLSCSIMYGVQPIFNMGMSEQEFREANKNKPELVLATEDGIKVYRTLVSALDYNFFFFRNEKLIRFEKGTHADDYKFIPVP